MAKAFVHQAVRNVKATTPGGEHTHLHKRLGVNTNHLQRATDTFTSGQSPIEAEGTDLVSIHNFSCEGDPRAPHKAISCYGKQLTCLYCTANTAFSWRGP